MNRRAPVGAADPAKVRDLMEHLVRAFEEYCNSRPDGEQVQYLDAFMGFHNAHKAIVLDLVQRSELRGEARRTFLRMARDTWADAMEEQIRRTHE